MLAPFQETLVRACALLLTPNHDFKEWLKTTVPSNNIFPVSLDKIIDEEVLYNHSITFITPVFHGQEELGHFIDAHHQFILHSLLLAWPFSMEAFQASFTRQSLGELFDAAYYFYLINFLGPTASHQKEVACSVTTIRPKRACLEWIHKAGIDELDDLALDILRKFGVALLTPSFPSREAETNFIQEHCSRIWAIGLRCYCEDESRWPTERTYEKLFEWFDCTTCYPVVDLTQMHLTKKAA